MIIGPAEETRYNLVSHRLTPHPTREAGGLVGDRRVLAGGHYPEDRVVGPGQGETVVRILNGYSSGGKRDIS